MTLLCLMSSHAGLELAEECSDDVALEAASDLACGASFGTAPGNIRASGGVVAHASSNDDINSAIELSVS